MDFSKGRIMFYKVKRTIVYEFLVNGNELEDLDVDRLDNGQEVNFNCPKIDIKITSNDEVTKVELKEVE